MFDFSWSQIMLIGVVALILIGPKDLPIALRAISNLVKKARAMASEFHTHVDDLMKDADLKDVRDQFKGIRNFDIRSEIEKAVDPDRSIRVDGPTAAKNALRRRALYPSSQAVMDSYRGRGAFVTWTEQQLADYVAAGFHPTADGQVTLACTPQWEASNFLSLAPNPWAAFKHTRGPVRILLAEHDSSVGLKGHEEEMAALGRVRIELIPGSSHFLPMEQPEFADDEGMETDWGFSPGMMEKVA